MAAGPRILLVDPSDDERGVLAERLELQGFEVAQCKDGADGAIQAMQSPPAAVVADLSMPSISGVQLCRLLGSEPGTAHVPVVLRGAEGRRNHFWAEQAGASAFVVKGRMGELVRALRRALERAAPTAERRPSVAVSEGLDVRGRIAAHLDAALFDSVVAAEVRRLGTSESFDRLIDLLSQFVSQVTTYRWMAIVRASPIRVGLHTNPACRSVAWAEAKAALVLDEATASFVVEDTDAVADLEGPRAICEPILFGEKVIGALALAPRAPVHPNDPLLVRTIARELGPAVRMATLVEESRHLASVDALTGLVNRRAFLDWARRELSRSVRYDDSLSVILLDIDHFKQINDLRGHASGDAALRTVAGVLARCVRSCDVVARWGGEEFLIALPSTPLAGACEVAERARREIERNAFVDVYGAPLPVTASFGVAELAAHETVETLVDRADLAMYRAKTEGRNRVRAAEVVAFLGKTEGSAAFGAAEPRTPTTTEGMSASGAL